MTTTIQKRDQWEKEYQSGAWDRLADGCEFARYTLLAGYIQRSGSPVRLLDIGCGEGVILRYLNLDQISSYTGMDIVQAALDHITPRREQDRYICCSLEEFSPDAKWDVILFNEVLYYTVDPANQMARFRAALAPGGAFVISMYRKRNPLAYNNRCIRQVQQHLRQEGYTVEDAVVLSRADQSATWKITVAQPPQT